MGQGITRDFSFAIGFMVGIAITVLLASGAINAIVSEQEARDQQRKERCANIKGNSPGNGECKKLGI